MARIDGERRENGVDLALEHVDQVLAVVVIERRPVREADTRRGERRDDLIQEDVVLTLHELLDPAPDHGELLARAQAVDATRADAGGDLVLERGDPYLVELVEQLGEDGEEFHPLHEGEAVVLRQVQEPRPEVEP